MKYEKIKIELFPLKKFDKGFSNAFNENIFFKIRKIPFKKLIRKEE